VQRNVRCLLWEPTHRNTLWAEWTEHVKAGGIYSNHCCFRELSLAHLMLLYNSNLHFTPLLLVTNERCAFRLIRKEFERIAFSSWIGQYNSCTDLIIIFSASVWSFSYFLLCGFTVPNRGTGLVLQISSVHCSEELTRCPLTTWPALFWWESGRSARPERGADCSSWIESSMCRVRIISTPVITATLHLWICSFRPTSMSLYMGRQ
jgi:hypothetical protein